MTRGESFLNPLLRGAIKVAKDFGVFEKGTLLEHTNKFFTADKMVVNAIFFTGAAISGGVRDGGFYILHTLEKFTDQTGFPGARGCGDNKENACCHNGI